eukprot:361179_1
MRKYIIFLILLSIVKNRAIVPCVTTMTDWYKSGKCQNPDGTYKTRYQHICWTCIEAPTLRLTWDPPTHGHLTGKICPMFKISYDWYVWAPDSYPARPMYASRKFADDRGFFDYETELQRFQRYGKFKTNPCSSMSSAAGDTSRFVSCIYTLMCQETHEADPKFTISPPPPASGTVRVESPPGHSSRHREKKVKAPPPQASVKVRVGAPPGHSSRHREKKIKAPVRVGAPPGHSSRHREKKGKKAPPHHSSALVDFDDMLHYYIGGISDYLNNEYTDYDGYDLDDQFEEMLTDVYMEGYKAGLNVERKWS